MKKGIVCLFLVIALCIPVKAIKNVIYSWNSNEKNIALTFDDGPHPYRTREILDILDEYGVKATFFVVGQNAELYPELIEEEYKAGHEIGNHSFDHTDMKLQSFKQICNEIDLTEKIIYENIEYRTKLFRPPGGLIGEQVMNAASAKDYKVICWSIDTRDWAHTPTDDIVNNVMSSVEEGDIILFHDYISGDSSMPEALKIIIPRLLDEGYNFVTVSELINSY